MDARLFRRGHFNYGSLLRSTTFLLCSTVGFLSPSPNVAIAQVIGVQGFYAESSDFWDNVDKLKSSQNTEQLVGKLFESNKNKVSEGMGSAGIYYASKGSPLNLSFLNRGIVSLEVEGIAGGYIQNRISPVIDGYTTWAFNISTGVQRHLPVNETGWGLLLLSTTGLGRQELIQGAITDLLSETPQKESSLFFQGFDFGVEFQSLWSDHLRFRSGYYFLPTYFYSETDLNDSVYKIDQGRWSLRWRTHFDFTTRTADFTSSALELGGQVIAGPQPIPMNILPRIWDGVHHVNPKPAFGAAMGVGGVARWVSQSRDYSLEGFGGFYGGYWGAGLATRLSVFHIRAGTFGVEQSSNYQLRQTRVNFIDGGFSYDW